MYLLIYLLTFCAVQDSLSELTGAVLLRDIYFYGGIVSTVFLSIAFFIFTHFKYVTVLRSSHHGRRSRGGRGDTSPQNLE